MGLQQPAAGIQDFIEFFLQAMRLITTVRDGSTTVLYEYLMLHPAVLGTENKVFDKGRSLQLAWGKVSN
jgi:hypothetical protein